MYWKPIFECQHAQVKIPVSLTETREFFLHFVLLDTLMAHRTMLNDLPQFQEEPSEPFMLYGL